MFDWLQNLDWGTKLYVALVMVIVGYCFIIVALGWMGVVGTILLAGGGILWVVAENNGGVVEKQESKPWDKEYK